MIKKRTKNTTGKSFLLRLLHAVRVCRKKTTSHFKCTSLGSIKNTWQLLVSQMLLFLSVFFLRTRSSIKQNWIKRKSKLIIVFCRFQLTLSYLVFKIGSRNDERDFGAAQRINDPSKNHLLIFIFFKRPVFTANIAKMEKATHLYRPI